MCHVPAVRPQPLAEIENWKPLITTYCKNTCSKAFCPYWQKTQLSLNATISIFVLLVWSEIILTVATDAKLNKSLLWKKKTFLFIVIDAIRCWRTCVVFLQNINQKYNHVCKSVSCFLDNKLRGLRDPFSIAASVYIMPSLTLTSGLLMIPGL